MTRDALKAEIKRQLSEKGSVVIAIEGPCGAGKSTRAEELGREFNARVFHADDYFLRPEQRTPERLAEIGGNFDRERFFTEVAEPVRLRKDALCRKYSCSSGMILLMKSSANASMVGFSFSGMKYACPMVCSLS